ncbi:MAG: cytochrome c biogenesis protein CcsA [Deltaproteobacteria bacterium]|nr:cytochrome c biogenesis protein CcsA [Deltaproteobacteria bacterium]
MIGTTYFLHYLSLGFYGLAFVLACLSLAARRVPRVVAPLTAAMGLACQIVLLVLRWGAGGHLPVTGLFETQQFLALWVVAAALYFVFRYQAYPFLPAALAMAEAALLFASIGPKAVAPLTPAIDTPLFLIHVATSFAAYGLFAIGALLGLYRLLALRPSDLDDGKRMLDESIYVGYILFSWAMIVGSLWAYLAWGSYWTWKIKNLWSWILWFYYSGVLHVRNRSGWQGRPLNILAVAGFALVLFTYLGLGLLFRTSHPLI